MEINRTFSGLKLKRTYLGGSEKNENQILHDVDEKEDWLEYRKLASKYFDDQLHVIISWRTIINIISYIFVGLAIISLIIYINILNDSIYLYTFVFLISLSVLFNLIFLFFKQKLNKSHRNYDLVLGYILSEIEKTTKMKFSKNQ